MIRPTVEETKENKMSKHQLQAVSADILRLHRNTKSLMLATQDQGGTPDVSCAPYVLIDGCYYILISELAAHTAHLQHAPQAAILLIEDEALSHNIFARLRLSWVVMARMVAGSESCYTRIIDVLTQRLGQTVNLLKTMQDFRLCELRPQQGKLIAGFGQAYNLDARDLWSIVAQDAAMA